MTTPKNVAEVTKEVKLTRKTLERNNVADAQKVAEQIVCTRYGLRSIHALFDKVKKEEPPQSKIIDISNGDKDAVEFIFHEVVEVGTVRVPSVCPECGHDFKEEGEGGISAWYILPNAHCGCDFNEDLDGCDYTDYDNCSYELQGLSCPSCYHEVAGPSTFKNN